MQTEQTPRTLRLAQEKSRLREDRERRARKAARLRQEAIDERNGFIAFALDRCELAKGARVFSTDLYHEFVMFADETGRDIFFYSISMSKFVRLFEKHADAIAESISEEEGHRIRKVPYPFFDKDSAQQGRGFEGIRLRNPIGEEE